MCIAHRVDWVVLCNKKGYYIIISYVNVKTESKLATLKKRNKLRHLWGVWVVSQNTNEWRRRGHRQTDYRTRLTDFGKLRGGGAHLQPEHTLFRLSGTDKQLLSPSPSVKWLTNNKGREDKVNPVVWCFDFYLYSWDIQTIYTFLHHTFGSHTTTTTTHYSRQ